MRKFVFKTLEKSFVLVEMTDDEMLYTLQFGNKDLPLFGLKMYGKILSLNDDELIDIGLLDDEESNISNFNSFLKSKKIYFENPRNKKRPIQVGYAGNPSPVDILYMQNALKIMQKRWDKAQEKVWNINNTYLFEDFN